VLYVSAYDPPQGEMARRFLQKPFSSSDLIEAVGQLLPRQNEPA
jgi:FixJ family two-component response regulator